ncbi:MAG TPA: sterol carrier protein domain-containing protein, partial [Chloroflexia bacterium]|nr:sterol carrier protein domain-containing protein [Chloroflexia bacterium]
HDSQAKEVILTEPEDSRLLALLDDPRCKVEVEPGFMLRMVDVAPALSARGYAPGAQGRLVLRVAEGFVTRTPQTYTLDVSDGRGTATLATSDPDLSLDQRALAQIYAGYVTATEAAELGLIEVHDQAAIRRADSFFAGPRPHLSDFF